MKLLIPSGHQWQFLLRTIASEILSTSPFRWRLENIILTQFLAVASLYFHPDSLSAKHYVYSSMRLLIVFLNKVPRYSQPSTVIFYSSQKKLASDPALYDGWSLLPSICLCKCCRMGSNCYGKIIRRMFVPKDEGHIYTLETGSHDSCALIVFMDGRAKATAAMVDDPHVFLA